MCSIAHVPHCSCALSPMCPIPQGDPSLSAVLTMIPFDHVSYCPCIKKDVKLSKRCPSCQKDVKLSQRCQVVKKMSNCQKDVKLSKSQTHGLWRRFTKKFTHVDVNFDVTYDHHQKLSKCP